LNREYQYNFSSLPAGKYEVLGRERKAKTMVAVLEDHFQAPLNSQSLLNVGGSTGIIDSYLSDYFRSVVSVDIDEPAIEQARSNYKKDNLSFQTGDALNLQFSDNSFDVVICSQIYEHVSNHQKMLGEIFRVLVPGGMCYFAASNRLMWNEPHYNLPLLSVVPRPLAHLYVRLMKKGDQYHELHYTYWELKKLVRNFIVNDVTPKLICDPVKYYIDYMVPPASIKAVIAEIIAGKFHWLTPGYIWLLQKPSNTTTSGN
jgi:ubiquinone/menaquinone biosynthesis C-methylase UbiE